MSTRSQLTKDLNESVKALLGKHVKILLKNVVKLETKPDKTENRVLVFSPCRLFLLTAKIPTRIDTHCHYLEIQGIESKKQNQLSLTINEKVYTFITGDEFGSQEVDTMVQALYTAVHNIFPTVPLTYIIRRIEVIPESRVQYLEQNKYNETRGIGPCGGFSTQYACMCDYHTLPYRDEVAWDVDTIYLSHDTRELCLRDFDHLDPKDLIPIISALEYNTWFTKLRTSHIKLNHEAIERLLHIMKKSISLEELYLDNLGVKWEFAHKLSLSLISNGSTVLHTLDLSNNLIEDKGAASLCGFIAKVRQGTTHIKNPISRVPKGLIHLNIAHCGLTPKGIGHISHALSLNKCMPNTLTYLNLSGNSVKEDVANLCNFLAQPNILTHLDISKTDCSLENIFGALLRGCASNLVHLNVSHNVFNLKKSKELPPSFKQFFTSSLRLKYINMSSCKLPLDAVKNLLLGLACNETVADVTLDISCNNLGSQSSHVLESCIHGVRSISSLDISENNMDVELSSVLTAISKNKSIKHLYMGRNLANMKSKHIVTVMDTLIQLIQEEDCVLQTLSIPDCKLKADLYGFINALGSNQCLLVLDVSGNLMGDAGARLLGKALQINSHLNTIFYDRNSISLQGFADLAYALESNYTLRYMPVPIYDIAPCMKISSEKTESIMKRIQDILHRNMSPKRYSNGHAFRLQQGFLLSSTQQMVDKLINITQEAIRPICEEKDSIRNCDMEHTMKILNEAEKSKHLLSYLHEVIQKAEESGNPIDMKLRLLSNELHSSVTKYLQDIMEVIITSAEDECSTVFKNEKFQSSLRSAARVKNYLEPEFINSCVMDQTGTQVMNKINDLNLAVAALVSDKVTDEIIETLSLCHRELTGNESRVKRSSTPDVLRSMSRSSEYSRNEPSDNYINFHASDRSPIATPHLTTKRKSLHGRKLRPKSVVDCIEGISADDIPDLLPSLESSAEESLDSVSELPISVNQQLHHLAKGRPKRSKTRATSRLHIRSQEEQDESDLMDAFFRAGSVTSSTATPLISPSSDESISSLVTDVSPNQLSPNADVRSEQEQKNEFVQKSKSQHNSLPKKSHYDYLETTPRSISSDNLTKFSPSNISPLARRIANFEQSPNENEKFVTNRKFGRRVNERTATSVYKTESTQNLTMEERAELLENVTANHNVDLISHICSKRASTALFKSSEKNETSINEALGIKLKPPSPLTPKPRRWSMLDNGNNSSNEVQKLNNEPVTSGNTESEQEADNLPEKKSVRELAASLIKQSKESPDNQRKSEAGFNFMKPSNMLLPTPFLQKQSNEQAKKSDGT